MMNHPMSHPTIHRRMGLGLLAVCLALPVHALDFEGTRRAALRGDAQAQFSLGVMYHEGRVVAQSDAQAARWYRKAAEKGVVDAQYDLGLMYAEGRGVRKSRARALKWFRKAAAQGDEYAMLMVEELEK